MKRTADTFFPNVRLALIALLLTACGEDYHELVWSQTFESESTNYESCGTDIEIDPEGNIIVVGKYEGQINLGGQALPYTSGTARFIAKYTGDGSYIWSRQLVVHENRDLELAVDKSGNILLAKDFFGIISYAGMSYNTTMGRDVFVAKLDPTGELLWSQSIGGTDRVLVSGIDSDDQGNIILTGSFNESVDFGQDTLVSAGSTDGYLLHLGPDGDYQWSRRFGNEGGMGIGEPKVSSTGTIAFSGNLAQTSSEPDAFGIAQYSALGEGLERWDLGEPSWLWAWSKDSRDLFVYAALEEPQTLGETPISGDFLARVAPGGDPVWITEKPESERQWRDIAVDDQDRVHLVSDTRIGSGDGSSIKVTSYDADGDKLGRTTILNSLGGARVTAVAAGPDGRVVVTGCAYDDGFFSNDENLFIVEVRAP